jgi:DNA recombination protein Rad52
MPTVAIREAEEAEAFSPSDRLTRASELLKKLLPPEFVSKRPGQGGQTVHYIEAHRLLTIVNEVFGLEGWSSSVQNQSQHVTQVTGGKFNVISTATVRVTLSKEYGGVYREGVGYGNAENYPKEGPGREKAAKEAVTDAWKRAFYLFGNLTGACLYNKSYLSNLGSLRREKADLFDEERVFRLPHSDRKATPKRPCPDDGRVPFPKALSRTPLTRTQRSNVGLNPPSSPSVKRSASEEDQFGLDDFDFDDM